MLWVDWGQVACCTEEAQQQLMPLKAAGPECVLPRTLKVCADHLCAAIHSILSISLSSSDIPVMWKNIGPCSHPQGTQSVQS